jgi:anhydro-N-acetylmuramic acid kinase
MAAVAAERTGLTTVSDLRARDVVVGGQGFPLTPVVDFLLFQHAQEHRVLLHLGALATLVSLPGGGQLRGVCGFQAAPCNVLLDNLMRQVTGGRECFDAGGKHAVQGRCIEPLLERWLTHPVLQRRPPRGLSRQAFGEEFAAQAVQAARHNNWNLHDLLCTATHFVARAITMSLRFLTQLPSRILLSGGGVRNGFLWHLLEQQLAVPLEKTDVYGIPVQTRKAVAAAGLAALTMDSIPANLPAATGASGARMLGSITPGSAANWARCLSWMSSQAACRSVSAA